MDAQGTARLSRSLLHVPRAPNPSRKTWMWIGGGSVALIGLAVAYHRFKSRVVSASPGWTPRTGTLTDSEGLPQTWRTDYFSEADERRRAAEAAADGRPGAEYNPEHVGWSYSVSNVGGAGYPTVRSSGFCCYPNEQAAIDGLLYQETVTDFRED